MDHYWTSGHWWPPDAPERDVSGVLTLSTDGIILAATGPLIPAQNTVPIIHGRTHEGEPMTLFHVESSGFQESHTGDTGMTAGTYRVGNTLMGAHVAQDTFFEAQVEFDCLVPWLRPPPVMEWTGSPPIIPQLRIEPTEVARAKVDDGDVSIITCGRGTISTNEVTWAQHAIVELNFNQCPFLI